jgi:hypothetical protein
LIVLAAMFWMYKSVPADKVNELMDALAKGAEKTETPMDDLAIKIAKQLSELLIASQMTPALQTAGPGETITTNISSETTITNEQADTKLNSQPPASVLQEILESGAG